MKIKTQTRGFVSAVFAYFISMGAIAVSSAMTYIIEDYPQFSTLTIQVVVSTLPCLFIMVGNLLAPSISNVISKKITILLGCILFCLGIIPMFVTGFGPLVLSRLLVGFGIGLEMPMSSELIWKYGENPKACQKAIGWQQSGGGIGMLIMSFAGGALMAASYTHIYAVHLVGLIGFIVVLVLAPQDHPRTEQKEKALIGVNGDTIFWCVLIFIFITFLNPHSACLALKLSQSDWADPARIGNMASLGLSMLVLGVIIGGIIGGFIMQIFKKFGIAVTFVLGLAGFLMISLVPAAGAVYVGSLLIGAGMGSSMGAIMGSAGAGAKGPQYTAFAMTLCGAILTLGQFLCLYIVTPLTRLIFGIDWTYDNLYLLCAAGYVLCIVIVLIKSFMKKKVSSEV